MIPCSSCSSCSLPKIFLKNWKSSCAPLSNVTMKWYPKHTHHSSNLLIQWVGKCNATLPTFTTIRVGHNWYFLVKNNIWSTLTFLTNSERCYLSLWMTSSMSRPCLRGLPCSKRKEEENANYWLFFWSGLIILDETVSFLICGFSCHGFLINTILQ